jgi:hypothetical protein
VNGNISLNENMASVPQQQNETFSPSHESFTATSHMSSTPSNLSMLSVTIPPNPNSNLHSHTNSAFVNLNNTPPSYSSGFPSMVRSPIVYISEPIHEQATSATLTS